MEHNLIWFYFICQMTIFVTKIILSQNKIFYPTYWHTKYSKNKRTKNLIYKYLVIFTGFKIRSCWCFYVILSFSYRHFTEWQFLPAKAKSKMLGYPILQMIINNTCSNIKRGSKICFNYLIVNICNLHYYITYRY